MHAFDLVSPITSSGYYCLAMRLSASTCKAYLHRAHAIVVLTIVAYQVGIISRKINISLPLMDSCRNSNERMWASE